MASASGKGGEAFKAPPADLKPLAPFLQRAHETRTADPALSYWCNYHAAQLGIPLLNSLAPDSKVFLITLMDTLEAQKKSLAGNDVVNGDDIVAKAYVENVALKVFGGADDEDRRGKASRATARRFLIAANFIEVLTNFGKLDTEMEEKLKYAKWKAADIAKALREGRKPTAGPIGGAEEDGEGAGEQQSSQQASELDAAAAKLAGLDAHHAEKEDEYVAREMAKLTGDVQEPGAVEVHALSPDVEEPDVGASDPVTPRAQRSRRAESRLSFDTRALGLGLGGGGGGGEGVEGLPASSSSSLALPPTQPATASSPNFSMPWRGQLSRNGSVVGSSSQTGSEASAPSSPTRGGNMQLPFGNSSLEHPPGSAFLHPSQPVPGQATTSPGARPLPTPPPPSSTATLSRTASTRRGDALPLPPGGSGSTTPLTPPTLAQHLHLPQPSAPPSTFLPTSPQPPPFQPIPVQHAAAAVPTAPPQQPPLAEADMPTSLNPALTGRVQKLAKLATSALDYDDVETARRQLKEALDICEGRITSVKKS